MDIFHFRGTFRAFSDAGVGMYIHEASRLYIANYRRNLGMTHIEVTYSRNVSRRIVGEIVNTLSAKACREDAIPSESLDVYARRLGTLDQQRKLIMVRIYTDMHGSIRSREDMDRIQQETSSILSKLVMDSQIEVEVIAASTSGEVP